MLLQQSVQLDLLLGPGSQRDKLPPLMIAAMDGDEHALAATLDDGASISLEDWEGNVALSHAAMAGSVNALEKLLIARGGMACLEHQNERSSTPLLLAAENGHLRTLQKLLEYKACVSVVGANGRSALTMVCMTMWDGSEDISIYAAHALLDAGAGIEHKSRDGASPLFLAAERGLSRTVGVLLDRGAYVNAPCGQYHFTPLLVAAANGRARVIEDVLNMSSEHAADKQVADMSACDSEGNTALALAVLFQQHKYVRVVKLLLGEEIDCNVQNILGMGIRS